MMNERIRELAEQTHVTVLTTKGMENVLDGCYVVSPDKLQEFAESIVRECMRMCDVASVGHESHGHIKEANGCSSAKEYIAEHFEVEEQTVSQKMTAAGYTRRPRGWTKEDSE